MALADNPETEAPGLTIDDLAREVGMTVRNLREWRTLGLLPRAEMRGRVGFYDAAVVARVRSIKELHSEGFTLELIRRMMEASGDSADEVMRLAGALRSPFRHASPSVQEVSEALNDILGLTGEETDALTARIRSHLDNITEIFEEIWLRHIWQPFLDTGAPESKLEELQQTLARVQPLAGEAVSALFSVAMEARIEQSIAREVEAGARKRRGANR